MKKPLRHVFDYLILSLIMSASILLILIFSGHRTNQTITIIGTSLLYVIWGVSHHSKEGTLHPKVTWEYVLYAVLGTFLVLGLL